MMCLDTPAKWPFVPGFPILVSEVCYVDVLLVDAGLNMAFVCRVGGCVEYTLESFMVFLKGHVLSSTCMLRASLLCRVATCVA